MKMARIGLFIFLTMIAGITQAYAAAVPIDLNSWTEEGPGGGNWNVSGTGESVLQTVNSTTPTFFVSTDNYINTSFNGKFKVESSSDDDFIGFVFGYNSPLSGNGDDDEMFDFFLFDWKQTTQAASTSGFNLSRVSGDFSSKNISHGNTSSTNPFWSHEDLAGDPLFDVLASSTGAGRGWEDNVEYEFSLLYQTNRIKIDIIGEAGSAFEGGETIFDINGSSFQNGRFGFYNFSQQSVRYQGFTEETVLPPTTNTAVPEPSSMALLGLGLIGVVRRRFSRSK